MAEYRLARRVSEVADRLDRFHSLNNRSVMWLLGATVGLLLLAVNSWMASSLLSVPVIGGIAGLVFVVGLWLSRRPHHSLQDAATAIENRWPDLNSRLTTAIDLRPGEEAGGFNFLQHEVITETLLHSHRNDWNHVISTTRLNRARLRHFLCLVMFVAAFAGAMQVGMAKTGRDTNLTAIDNFAETGSKYQITVDPGDTQIERGTGLIVTARFDERVPKDVTLHTEDAQGQRNSRPLSKSMDDPLFGCYLDSIDNDLSYLVTFDGHDSEAFQIAVFDFPRLEQADATIVHPEYTGLGKKSIEDIRRLSMIEGSQVTLNFHFNKPVQEAILRDHEQNEINLLPVNDQKESLDWNVTLTPQNKQSLTLELLDNDGRRNKEPPTFVIDLIPNRPPDLAIEFPGRDIRISPLQEMPIEAVAADDFGLHEVGIIYQLPGTSEKTLKLGDGNATNADVNVAHELAMEDIAAQPNDLVSYYLYADDVGPDGESRRTFSDLYFAEIRHFDEEYREMQSPQGQGAQQPGGTPTDQLMELQRDIVNAIWKLIRRESFDKPTDDFSEDVLTVNESQDHAIEMGHELASSLEDALSQKHAAEAIEHMSSTSEALRLSVESISVKPLPDARSSAYDAYRALLKLQAREHLISRSQSSSQSQSQSSRQDLDQQLQDLELKNDRNRYENEQQEQPSADREQLQVLNRLRELARRQSGLNEKIQELENALREAESEEEQAEIERQLKRLREEQQELMRDLDELNERMNNEQNRRQMAEAREQAQDVRENLRRTSEALKDGQLSRALAAGTRAERELEQMKDELREQTAGQFSDIMRELRKEAQQLAEQQQKLGEALTQQPSAENDEPPQLKDDRTNDLQDRFNAQREQLTEFMTELKEVVEQSELNEPLLSKALYDAIRRTRVDRPEESLSMTGQFLKHGLTREAKQSEEQANRGIQKLQEGVEKAAESVLGNEIESLRRAQTELNELTRAIGDELAEVNAPSADTRNSDQSSQSDNDSSSPQSDETSNPLEQLSDQARGDGDQPKSHQTGQPSQGGTAEEPVRDAESTESEPSSNVLSKFRLPTGSDQESGSPASGGPHRPLTGTDFVQWSDGMRDVEEMVDDPELRSQIAQIRDRARQIRIDVKRHSKSPDWQLVEMNIYGPLLDLQMRLEEEIARREPSDAIVPIDRDPVPERYTDLVERYYERLGSGR